ncbi:MAG: aminoacyl-tRNA hydrolase [Acidobacteriota bacterium]
MWILLGLGNPGSSYANNRHNIGFWCADELARRAGVRLRRAGEHAREAVGQVAGEPVVLVEPRTFMNRSGLAARWALSWHGMCVQDLIAVHDDVDLPLGTLRIKQGGGHGGHNGLRSIIDELTADFIRVRLGIGRPSSRREDLAEWVLSDFDAAEHQHGRELAVRGADAVETILISGVTAAMNRFNASSGQEQVRTD